MLDIPRFPGYNVFNFKGVLLGGCDGGSLRTLEPDPDNAGVGSLP